MLREESCEDGISDARFPKAIILPYFVGSFTRDSGFALMFCLSRSVSGGCDDFFLLEKEQVWSSSAEASRSPHMASPPFGSKETTESQLCDIRISCSSVCILRSSESKSPGAKALKP